MGTVKRLALTAFTLGCVFLNLGTAIWAQGGYFSERNDEAYLILALKKQRARFEASRTEYETATALMEKDLISREKYGRIRANYLNEEITYQQAMLRVIFDQPHIVIEEAIKYQAEDGKKRVRLTLHNTTGGIADYEKLMETDSDLFDASLRPDKINNVFISLHESRPTGGLGPIISQPYEDKIETIRFGESGEVDFLLLKDVEEVIVTITYAGVTEQKHIYLQKDAIADRVIASSLNFSQETNLGESATFSLDLERFSDDNDVFRLAVINLPRQISYSFLDPSSARTQRLSQVNFTQGVTSKQLALTIYLPERADEQVVIDKTITFYALVLPQEEWQKLQPLDGKRLPEEEIEKISGGKAKLELTTRGVGRIEVRALNLYHEIKTDDAVDMEITVRNDGTRRLDNIRIRANMPPNWQSSVEPDLLPSLGPAKEQIVRVGFQPPEGVGVGDYEVQIQTTALADNRAVETQDKTVRIHVSARTNLILSAALVFSVIGMVVGIVWYGVRLTKR